jgi:hypothetical protein
MSYYDTAYNDFDAARRALTDLGVRNVRDGACAGCIDQIARLAALGRDGVRLTLIMGKPGAGGSLDSLAGAVEGSLAPYLAALEGPNEYDISGDPAWAANLRSYQQQLWTRVHASRALARVPVLAPSLARAGSFAELGDISASLDCGNIHPYAGGGKPADTLAYNLSLARIVSAAKPVCATEAGYHNALAETTGQRATSERAAGAYVPRLYLDFFAAGVPRTFLYELVDEWRDPGHRRAESSFGLLRNDFSPKPAYRSLRTLLRLTVPHGAIEPRPLRVAVTGSAPLRWMLQQTTPKEYAVVLWRDVSVWDAARGAGVAVASAAARIRLGQRTTVTDVTVADAKGGVSRSARMRSGGLTVGVGSYPVVVRVRTG